MSNRNGTLIAIAAVVVVGAASLMPTAAQDSRKDAAAADAERSPFKGELIVVSLKDAEFGNALMSPRIEQIGGVVFITGTGFDTGRPDEWTAGATVRVPLSAVSHLAEFDKAEQYRKLAARNQASVAPRTEQEGTPRRDDL